MDLPSITVLAYKANKKYYRRDAPMIVLPSHNFTERRLPVSLLILHYTGMRTAQAALDRLRDPAAQVSAHYVIDTNGDTYALVDEAKRAHHAGVSYWRGVTDINSASIGIELVNKGHEFGYTPFPDAQIDALTALCKDILSRRRITAVLGHSDVAPTRKQDPGELFPWAKLSENGISFWTDDFCPPVDSAENMLKSIGYDTTDLNAAVTAFQRHFYPAALLSGGTRTLERISAVLKGVSHDL